VRDARVRTIRAEKSENCKRTATGDANRLANFDFSPKSDGNVYRDS
jgi:hypothetical protein